MEKAAAIGNSRQLFRLIKEMTIRNTAASETISEKDGTIIYSQFRRLNQRTWEYCKTTSHGSAFWLNSNRFDHNSSNYSSKYRRRNTVRYAVDTVNPVIPTCWFKHLPHESGTGLPVGSPLSRSFQSHIASHRLHSADFNPTDTISVNTETIKLKPVMGLADRLLHDRVHATFWQSYSKRIKLSKSLRNDCEQWWAAKAKMEKAAAIGNTRQLYRIIKETGINKSSSKRLERWVEHFREQFSWPSATLQLPTIPRQCEWNIEVGPPTLAEAQKAIVDLKRGRAAGPDGLAPEVFKDCGPI
ncbi:unnamed protein product, partial [Schistosoma curassoni]|uniref:HTH CENPB-type domain-containing protein n=1 Tax=Schistosoma curassoni TaxID=6186 RepID=A0A183JQ32_9TREM